MWKALSSWEPPEKKTKGRGGGGVDDTDDEVSQNVNRLFYCIINRLITFVYRKLVATFLLTSVWNEAIPGANNLRSRSHVFARRTKEILLNGRKRYVTSFLLGYESFADNLAPPISIAVTANYRCSTAYNRRGGRCEGTGCWLWQWWRSKQKSK
jgi:hypothetical protein